MYARINIPFHNVISITTYEKFQACAACAI
jgi:hypothetical protein